MKLLIVYQPTLASVMCWGRQHGVDLILGEPIPYDPIEDWRWPSEEKPDPIHKRIDRPVEIVHAADRLRYTEELTKLIASVDLTVMIDNDHYHRERTKMKEPRLVSTPSGKLIVID